MGNFFSACNIAHPASLPSFEKGTLKTVHVAKNVDFADGNISRRSGPALVSEMVDAHSLHATETALYLARASKLYRVTDLESYAEAELYSLTANLALSYARIKALGSSYASNGTDAVVINEATHAVASWLVATPAAPTIGSTAGSLNAGEYRIAIAQRDSVSGRRSPVSNEATHILSAPGGLSVTLPALASGMTHTDVFVSAANGGTLTLQTSATSGSATIASLTATGRQAPPRSQKCLPAGKYLAAFKGRLLSAKGSVLSISDAYHPTMGDALKGFVPFPADITAVVPVESGVWVGTTANQYFLSGTDPAKWEAITSREVGVADGSAFFDPVTKLRGWFDVDGVRLLGEAGEATSPQGRVFAPRFAAAAKAFYDRRTENLVVALSGTETVSKREHPSYAEYAAK